MTGFIGMDRKTPFVKRYHGNPILTRDDVPYPVATVHNAGVIKHNDRYVMLFRAHRHNGLKVQTVFRSRSIANRSSHRQQTTFLGNMRNSESRTSA